MAIGLRPLFERLTAIVEAVQPREQVRQTFFCVEEDGLEVGLEQRFQSGSVRGFEWSLSEAPTEYGVAGPVASCAVQAGLTLTVGYATQPDRRLLQIQMGQDAQALQAAIMDPAEWQTATTGIDHITPPADGGIEYTEGEEGVVLMQIPFQVQYREAT